MDHLQPSIAIVRASVEDSLLLETMAVRSFLESHGHSASKADTDNYIQGKLTRTILEKELENEDNIYHILYYEQQPAGFSKIIFNTPHPEIAMQAVTKMERIYFLKEYYHLGLGQQLFDFNLTLSKQNAQQGMWLYVWMENERAIRFYERQGFQPIGRFDFQLSPTHSNPNHLMWLRY